MKDARLIIIFDFHVQLPPLIDMFYIDPWYRKPLPNTSQSTV